MKTILPIVQLDTPQRMLAIRLIRHRTGSPPWDLRDDPANQRFLHMLIQQGVKVDPWVNGIGKIQYQGDTGKSCFLSLEDDPLEIFQMGAHFETCLSPDSFNFFSVFGNAADINKRVLYGRDHSGKVIGRTLLALTNQGGLVTFHSYCHNTRSGYGDAVASFVKQLAKRMRTILISYGTVTELVSTEWYDDGPIDLGGSFPALEEGSSFRTRLTTISPKTLPALLKEALAPIPLNELTIPLVLELPEILKNKPLALPLIDLVATITRLPFQAYIQSLRIAHHCGIESYAMSKMGKHVINELLAQGEDAREQDLEIVIHCYPKTALRLLKGTREKGIRCWQDEWYDKRQKLIVQALTLSGRTKQADDLLITYGSC